MRYPTRTAFFAILGLSAMGQVALAANMPVRKAAPAPIYVPYNWNGWYWALTWATAGVTRSTAFSAACKPDLTSSPATGSGASKGNFPGPG